MVTGDSWKLAEILMKTSETNRLRLDATLPADAVLRLKTQR